MMMMRGERKEGDERVRGGEIKLCVCVCVGVNEREMGVSL